MKTAYLCLDVGGTEIKAAPIEQSGTLLCPLCHFPSKANETSETILRHFVEICKDLSNEKTTTVGIRLAFPGPFDYQKGICLLQGLSKYDSLYGVNLRRELSLRLKISFDQIRFANDASAFAVGEMNFGPAKGAARAMFICIGTGCGSAFGINDSIAPDGTSGVPDSGYIYDTSFLDGCIDDYLSRRGIMNLTKEYLGTPLDGNSLAQLVRQGSQPAKDCFLAFGMRIKEALTPFWDSFRPNVLCLGGQITRSASMFLPPIEEACHARGIKLYVTEDTSIRTLQGLTRI